MSAVSAAMAAVGGMSERAPEIESVHATATQMMIEIYDAKCERPKMRTNTKQER